MERKRHEGKDNRQISYKNNKGKTNGKVNGR